MLIKLFACAEAGSEDFLVGTERTGSELVPLLSELRLKFPSAGAVTEVLGVFSVGTEEGSDRLLVEASEILTGTETGSEVLIGSETGPENIASVGLWLEVSSAGAGPEVVASVGRLCRKI